MLIVIVIIKIILEGFYVVVNLKILIFYTGIYAKASFSFKETISITSANQSKNLYFYGKYKIQ